MKSQCPCGAVYTIKPEFLGKRTLCKSCGHSFIIETWLDSRPPAALSSAVEPFPQRLPAPPPAPPPTPPAFTPRESSEIEPDEIPSAWPSVLEDIPAAPSESAPAFPASETALEDIGPAKKSTSPLVAPALPWRVRFLASGIEAGGRRPFLALALAAVAGTLVGAGLMGLIRQGEIDVLGTQLAAAGRELQSQRQTRAKLGDLKKELDRLQGEVRQLEGADYPPGSIPRTLTEAAVLEYKTAEALLRQQVAALESGARLTVTARGTAPDSKLAAAVEGERARLEGRLEELRREAEGRAEEPRSLVQTAIATEELNLAILNRNRLIAKYGLSAPLPPQRPAGADE